MIDRGQWKARIVSNQWYSPELVRLLMFREAAKGEYEVLTVENIGYVTVPEGTSIQVEGFPLTANALKAIREAIDEWQGIPQSNAEAESKVLREVLTKEQSRVDKILDRERSLNG